MFGQLRRIRRVNDPEVVIQERIVCEAGKASS
jgi:hypothetical protein